MKTKAAGGPRSPESMAARSAPSSRCLPRAALMTPAPRGSQLSSWALMMPDRRSRAQQAQQEPRVAQAHEKSNVGKKMWSWIEDSARVRPATSPAHQLARTFGLGRKWEQTHQNVCPLDEAAQRLSACEHLRAGERGVDVKQSRWENNCVARGGGGCGAVPMLHDAARMAARVPGS